MKEKLIKTLIFVAVVVIAVWFSLILSKLLGADKENIVLLVNYTNSNPEKIGIINEVISVSSGGFGTETTCVIKVNNKTRTISGYVCNDIREEDELYYKEFNGNVYIQDWSVSR